MSKFCPLSATWLDFLLLRVSLCNGEEEEVLKSTPNFMLVEYTTSLEVETAERLHKTPVIKYRITQSLN